MNGWRGGLEITLHIGFCRWGTIDLGVVVDEGQILTLFPGVRRRHGKRCLCFGVASSGSAVDLSGARLLPERWQERRVNALGAKSLVIGCERC